MTREEIQQIIVECIDIEKRVRAIHEQLFNSRHDFSRHYYHAEAHADSAEHEVFAIANTLGVVFKINPHNGELRENEDKEEKE